VGVGLRGCGKLRQTKIWDMSGRPQMVERKEKVKKKKKKLQK